MVFDSHPKSILALLFPLAMAVAFGVGVLLSFHVYLTLTAQTTIEMQKNFMRAQEMKDFGEKFVNPFDTGRWRGNFEQVYGDRPLLLALLPSLRPPPKPRIPIFLEKDAPVVQGVVTVV